MVKFKTSVLLISSLLIAVVTAALTYFALAASGVIEAGKIELVIQIEDNEKVYDGKALYADNFKLVSGNLAETHEIIVDYTSSRIDVGNSSALGTARVINENNIDVTKDYDIQVIEGALSITSRPITVAVKDTTKVYDGTPIDATDIVIKSGALVAGHTAHPNFSVVDANKNAGNYLCNVTASIVDGSGVDVSSNYKITSETGTLTINKAPLVIRSKSTEVEFSNDMKADFSYEVLSGGLINGDYVSSVIFDDDFKVKVGSNPIKIKNVAVNDLNENDVTNNYYIIVQNTGILTVKKYVLDIKVNDAEFTYDGTEKHINFDDAIADFVINEEDNSYLEANSFKIAVADYPKLTNAGIVANKVDFKVMDVGNTDITEYFIFNQTSGYLKVNKATVNVGLNEKDYIYDGTQKSPEIEFKYVDPNNPSNEIIIDKEEIDYKLKYASTDKSDYFTDLVPVNAGDYYALIYSAKIKEDSEYFSNYEINIPTLNYEQYTIKPKEIKYEWDCDNLDTYPYISDVQHPNILFKVINDEDGNNTNVILDNDEVSVEYSFYNYEDLTNIIPDTSINSGIYCAQANFIGLSSSNYSFVGDSSPMYVIEPRVLFLSWDDLEYIYNGKAQYPILNINDDDFYLDDDLKFTYNILDSSNKESDSINSGLYSIEFVLGGTAKDNYLINAGMEISKSYEIKQKHVELTFNEYYEMKFNGSQYKVDCNDIAQATGLAYGHNLKLKEDVYITIDEIIEVAKLKASSEPKTKEFELVIVDNENEDVSFNYDVSDLKKELKLSFIKQEISYIGGYISKVYDGKPIVLGLGQEKYDGYATSLYFDVYSSLELPSYCTEVYGEFDVEEELDNGMVQFLGETEATTDKPLEIEYDVRIYLNNVSPVKDITDLYNIDVEPGIQEIFPKELTISLGNYTKEYDGYPFDEANVKPTIIGAIAADYSDIYMDVISNIAIDGNSDMVGTWNITSSYANDNYSVSINDGSVTVNKAKLKVSALSYVMSYSGEALEDDVEITVDDPTGTYNESDFNVSYDEYINVGIYKLTPTNDSIDESVYDLEVSSGTLTITKKNAVINLGNYSREYDGFSFTEENVTDITTTGFVNSEFDSTNLDIIPFEEMNAGVYKICGSYDDETGNYNVTVIDGTLTITKKNAVINLGNYSREYDESYAGFTLDDATNITTTGFISGEFDAESLNINMVDDINAGIHKISSSYNDETGNYNVTVIDGTLTITPKKLSIIIKDYSREYIEDEYYTQDDVIYEIPSELDYVSGNIDIPINVTNAGSYTIFGTADYGSNYDVTVVSGTLTIVPVTVIVSIESITATRGSSIDADDINLVINRSGFELDYGYSISCSTTDLDNVQPGVHVINLVFDATDYHPNYYVIAAPGTLTVI